MKTKLLAIVFCFVLLVPSGFTAQASASTFDDTEFVAFLRELSQAEISRAGATTVDQQLRAIYDFVTMQFNHTHEERTSNRRSAIDGSRRPRNTDVPFPGGVNNVLEMDGIPLIMGSRAMAFSGSDFIYPAWLMLEGIFAAPTNYASLFTEMARSIGFDASAFNGWFMPENGQRFEHTWAGIRLDNNWYLFDTQQESFTNTTGQPRHRYFMQPISEAAVQDRYHLCADCLAFMAGFPVYSGATITSRGGGTAPSPTQPTQPEPTPEPTPPAQGAPPLIQRPQAPQPQSGNRPNSDIAVNIDGYYVNFTGQEPVIVGGRTLVPVRGVFEQLGFVVTWNGELRQATLTSQLYTVVITIDSDVFTANGTNHRLDVPAQIINNSTMIPLRAVLETVGFELDWDADASTVLIRCLILEAERFFAVPLAGRSAREFDIITGQRTTITTGEWTRNTSRITLPNRRLTQAEMQLWIYEYDANGGPTDFELEVVRLINEIRRDYNLPALSLDRTLGMSTRFYAQTLDNLRLPLGHREGPYGGSMYTVAAFGGGWNTANGTRSSGSPQAAVTSWMGSPGHRNNILNSAARVIGIGQFGSIVYMQTYRNSNG